MFPVRIVDNSIFCSYSRIYTYIYIVGRAYTVLSNGGIFSLIVDTPLKLQRIYNLIGILELEYIIHAYKIMGDYFQKQKNI